MESNLYVEDKNINVSRSSFTIYTNEQAKYEGRNNKTRVEDMQVMMAKAPKLIDRMSIAVLDTIYKLNCCTSRQITEYMNYVYRMEVQQGQITKILDKHKPLSTISRYSFISDENSEGTNLKFYTLDKNGKALLQQWKYTDPQNQIDWKILDMLPFQQFAKAYLIRNQYYLKLLNEGLKVENIRLKKSLYADGIGMIYNVKGVTHIVIPVRNYENYIEMLSNTFERMKSNPEIISAVNKKYIILGEDAKFNHNVFFQIGKNKMVDMTTLMNNIYYVTDLSLFSEDFKNCFNRHIVHEETKKAIMQKSIIIPEFN